MEYHSEIIVKEFFKICDWLFQTHQLRKYLFDENPDENLLKDPMHEHFFYRIKEITQESWLHQLAKLHDPAVQGGNINLSVDYIIEFGGWDVKCLNELSTFKKKMLELYTPIKTARNKLLSHNDLKTIIGGKEFYGEFDQGADEKYFETLGEFCDLVSQKTLQLPFVYDDLVKNDVEVFMSQFKRGKYGH